MPEPEPRVWPLGNLTSMLVEVGRQNEALTIAEGEDPPFAKPTRSLAPQQRIARLMYVIRKGSWRAWHLRSKHLLPGRPRN
jgi:hypothetical protein